MAYAEQQKKNGERDAQGRKRKGSENNHSTGIPVQMKKRMEEASGYSLDKVRIYYNSTKPAGLNAYSYAQGDNVYLAPGRSRDLQHELIHVIQQKQGLVYPTERIGGVPINASPNLEAMADRGIIIAKHVSSGEGSAEAGQQRWNLVAQRIPNIGRIAIERFRGKTGGRQPFNRLDVPQRLAILRRELPHRLVRSIVAAAAGNNAYFDYDTVTNYISAYYNTAAPPVGTTMTVGQGLQANLGADLRKLNPATANIQYLPVLSTVLQNVLLPRIRVAVQKGRNARGNADIPAGVNGATNIDSPAGVNALQWRDVRVGREMREDIVEGTVRFNELLRPRRRGARNRQNTVLPNVVIKHGPVGATTNTNSVMTYGAAAGPSQVVHEMGHHLENNLTVQDLAILHNFLRARTRNENGGVRPAGFGLFGHDVAGTYGNGYNAELPPMVFQNFISRNILKSGNGLIRFGLYNMGNWALSGLWRLFGQKERGQRFVDDFFLQESNAESTSYATLTDDDDGMSEFVSTTAELLATERGASELIRTDPLRAVLFVYLSNKSFYAAIKAQFNRTFQNAGQTPPSLDDLIHIIR